MSFAETVCLTIRRSSVRALYDVGSIIVGAAMVALSARVALPLPFTPVPITGQTLAVLVIAAALGSKRGALSVLLYLTWGALSVPLFAGGVAGVARLVGPTGGYLVGMLAAAWIVGRLMEAGWGRRTRTAIAAMALGTVAIYTLGLVWLSRFVPVTSLLNCGLYPFVLGDLCKILIGGLSVPLLARWHGGAGKTPLS